jgi:DUF2934 family protein
MGKAIHSKGAEISSRHADPEQIARLAYSYWEDRHGQGGTAEEDWYRAEQELVHRQIETEGRRASRPVSAAGRPLSLEAGESN